MTRLFPYTQFWDMLLNTLLTLLITSLKYYEASRFIMLSQPMTSCLNKSVVLITTIRISPLLFTSYQGSLSIVWLLFFLSLFSPMVNCINPPLLMLLSKNFYLIFHFISPHYISILFRLLLSDFFINSNTSIFINYDSMNYNSSTTTAASARQVLSNPNW